jgi:alpha-tubulin suppressor-like RCC1 family protein
MRKIHKTIQLFTALLLSQTAQAQDYWLKVEGGTEYSLALKSDSTLWSWGHNANGQLGLGNTINQIAPNQIGSDSNWKQISAGALHVLAVKNDGTLWAWGNNGYGRLGDGTTVNQTSPLQISSCVTNTDPPTASAQTFCSGATIANLVATGTDLQWMMFLLMELL